jgi:hypothetical protein
LQTFSQHLLITILALCQHKCVLRIHQLPQYTFSRVDMILVHLPILQHLRTSSLSTTLFSAPPAAAAAISRVFEVPSSDFFAAPAIESASIAACNAAVSVGLVSGFVAGLAASDGLDAEAASAALAALAASLTPWAALSALICA